MNLELKNLLESQGASLVGFGDLSEIPAYLRFDLRVGISIAVALDPQIIAGIRDGPTREYVGEYRRANDLLDSLSASAASLLEKRGYKAHSFPATQAGIDPRTHTTRLPHKTTATRSGLGWIGKCALLVTEPYGPAVRLTTVLTDAELACGAPEDRSRCADCVDCVEACPGKAPSGRHWEPHRHRDAFFDAFACHDAARDLALERTGFDESICGMCIAACPWTIKYLNHTPTAP